MGKSKKTGIFKYLYIIVSLVFILPSLRYLVEHKTVLGFDKWFLFLLNDSSRETQTIQYIFILALITIVYILIIKYRQKLFDNIKKILIFTGIIGLIYVFSIPFTSSDIFYYMGVGRIDSAYGQNPYYTTIREFVDENSKSEEQREKLEKDTVLIEANQGDWADTTVVYGPVWQLVCKTLTIFSFGNVDIGLLIFKIVNLIIHIFNCYLIYKLTGKKVFAIIYGLNPFILIEAIMCVHNDIFVILFTLLSLYFMLKKRKLAISMGFLALATGIKYFSIMLLPFMLIYYFRKEKPLIRFVNCLKYGVIFVIVLIIPYLLYIKDFSILSGMLTQQTKIAKSIYIPITEFFKNVTLSDISTFLLYAFAIVYFFTCLTLLFKKKITFSNVTRKYMIFLLIFVFGLITQFEPWYLMWLIPVFMWQSSSNIKLIILIGIIVEFANSVFLLNGEGFENGTPFVLVMYTLILASALVIEKQKNKRKMECFTKRLKEEKN